MSRASLRSRATSHPTMSQLQWPQLHASGVASRSGNGCTQAEPQFRCSCACGSARDGAGVRRRGDERAALAATRLWRSRSVSRNSASGAVVGDYRSLRECSILPRSCARSPTCSTLSGGLETPAWCRSKFLALRTRGTREGSEEIDERDRRTIQLYYVAVSFATHQAMISSAREPCFNCRPQEPQRPFPVARRSSKRSNLMDSLLRWCLAFTLAHLPEGSIAGLRPF